MEQFWWLDCCSVWTVPVSCVAQKLHLPSKVTGLHLESTNSTKRHLLSRKKTFFENATIRPWFGQDTSTWPAIFPEASYLHRAQPWELLVQKLPQGLWSPCRPGRNTQKISDWSASLAHWPIDVQPKTQDDSRLDELTRSFVHSKTWSAKTPFLEMTNPTELPQKKNMTPGDSQNATPEYKKKPKSPSSGRAPACGAEAFLIWSDWF